MRTQLLIKLSKFKYWLNLQTLKFGKHKEYQKYLDVQLKRTLSKKTKSPNLRMYLLTEALLENTDISSDSHVLCIGCRNTYEVDLFKEKGFSEVKGIDLYSEDPNILVMDMHNMSFKDNSFDVVYSSHSFEHSYDPYKVVKEIVRILKPGGFVAIEVPVDYETGNSDLLDVGNSEELINLFTPHVKNVYFKEKRQPKTTRNQAGTSIVRVIFSINKNN